MTDVDGYAIAIAELQAAVDIIETELGYMPEGIYASVRTRLDILETRINTPFSPVPNATNPFFIGTSGVTIAAGNGDPNSLSIAGIQGSLWLRTDGSATQGLYSNSGDGYWSGVSGGGGGGGGIVDSVTGTLPIVSTGGANPIISINAATDSTAGSLSAADKTKLDGLPSTAIASLSVSSPILSTGGSSPTISIQAASDSVNGYLSSADKTKLDGISTVVSSVGGTAPIVSSGGLTPTISISAATDSTAGSLSAADKTKLDNIPTTIFILERYFAAGLFSNGQNSFSRVGSRTIDMSQFPATIGALSRTVKFLASVDMTAGATTVEIQLVDITDADAIITGTDMTSSSTSSTEKNSGALTVGSASGNIRNDKVAVYEVQLKMNGGTLGTDQVFCTNARIEVSYS